MATLRDLKRQIASVKNIAKVKANHVPFRGAAPLVQLLLDLEGEALLREGLAFLDERERVIDVGHRFAGELDVDHRADALDDPAFVGLSRAHGLPFECF